MFRDQKSKVDTPPHPPKKNQHKKAEQFNNENYW